VPGFYVLMSSISKTRKRVAAAHVAIVWIYSVSVQIRLVSVWSVRVDARNIENKKMSDSNACSDCVDGFSVCAD